MPPLSTLSLSGTNIVLSLGYVLLGAYVWRRYDEIGSRSLSIFAGLWGVNFALVSLEIFIVATYGVTSGAELGSLSVPMNVRLLLVVIAPLTELFTVVAIYAWLWFVLDYTTRLDRQEKIAIGSLAGLLILFTALNALVGVFTTFGYLDFPADFENSFHRFAGILEILGTGIAIGAGIAQLFRTSRRHPLFQLGAVPALSVSVLLLYLIRYVYRLGFIPSFRTIELLRLGAHVLGIGGLWVAVWRYRIFSQLPASQTVGRDTALDNIETAIVLLNEQYNITDLNPAGESLFGVESIDMIGRPLSALLPDTVDPDAIRAEGETIFDFPNSDRIVQAQTAITTDDSGREVGRTTVFKDITEERRRQQRIQVLNRVLRHNLRNDVSVATGFLEAIAEGAGEAEELVPRIQSKLDGLVTMGSKAREIEDVLSVDPTVDSAVPLADVVREAIDGVEADLDASSIAVEVPDHVAVSVNPVVLRSVLVELVENAVEHTDGADVTVAFAEDAHELVVHDTGPGIPEHETEIFRRGEETDLQHGSGLGLWLVKWGVDRIGGDIRFDTTGSGTRAVVTLPANRIENRASEPA